MLFRSGSSADQKQNTDQIKQSEHRPQITAEKVNSSLEHAKELLRRRNPSMNGGLKQEDLAAYKQILGKPKDQANIEAKRLYDRIQEAQRPI